MATPKTFEISWDDPFITEISRKMQKDHMRIDVLERFLETNRVRVQKLEYDILSNATALSTVAQAFMKGDLVRHFRHWLPLEGTFFDNAAILIFVNTMLFSAIIPWICYNLFNSAVRKLFGHPSSSTRQRQTQRQIDQMQTGNVDSQRASRNAVTACHKLGQKFDELLEKYEKHEQRMQELIDKEASRKSDHKIRMEALESSMKVLNKDRDLLKKQADAFDKISDRIDNLEDDMKGVKSRVSGLEQETARLESVKADKVEAENLKKEMTQLTKRVEEAELDKSFLTDFKTMNSRLAKLEETSASAGTSNTEQISSQDFNKINERLEKLEDKALRLEQVKLDKSHLEDIEKLRSRLVKLEDDASRQAGSSNKHQQQADIASLQTRLDQLEQGAVRQPALDSLSAEVEKLKKNDGVQDLQLSVCEERLEPVENRLGQAEESLKQLSQMKDEAAARKVDIENLKWKIEQLLKDNLKLNVEARLTSLEADDIVEGICNKLKELEEVDRDLLDDVDRLCKDAVLYTDASFKWLCDKVDPTLLRPGSQSAPRGLSSEPEPEPEAESQPEPVQQPNIPLAELSGSPPSPIVTEAPVVPQSIPEDVAPAVTQDVVESSEQATQDNEASTAASNANPDDDGEPATESTSDLTKAQRESKRKNNQRKIARARKVNTERAAKAAKSAAANSSQAPETQQAPKDRQDSKDKDASPEDKDTAPEEEKK